MDNKYILISVCDREILTEVFNTLAEAQACMHKEMIEWVSIAPECSIARNMKKAISDLASGVLGQMADVITTGE